MRTEKRDEAFESRRPNQCFGAWWPRRHLTEARKRSRLHAHAQARLTTSQIHVVSRLSQTHDGTFSRVKYMAKRLHRRHPHRAVDQHWNWSDSIWMESVSSSYGVRDPNLGLGFCLNGRFNGRLTNLWANEVLAGVLCSLPSTYNDELCQRAVTPFKLHPTKKIHSSRTTRRKCIRYPPTCLDEYRGGLCDSSGSRGWSPYSGCEYQPYLFVYHVVCT